MKADKFLIYTDMDGSLLSDWELGPVVPEYNLRMLADFRAEGGLFSAASGRQYEDIMSYLPPGSINFPMVCANGSLIYDPAEDKILEKSLLPKPFLRECIELCRQEQGLWMCCSGLKYLHSVVQPGHEPFPRGYMCRDISEEELLEGEFVKMCIVCRSSSMMEELKERVSAFRSFPLMSTAASSPQFLECMTKGVSKARGIETARRAAGAQDRILVCLGDFFNDREMLSQADIAACPENSPEEIKAICSLQLCSNNKGALGDLIERLYNL